VSIAANPGTGTGETVGVILDGYEFRPGLTYDPTDGMWIADRGAGVLRLGINALSADSYGALAQLVLDPVGTALTRGGAFGSLEAAKFVGPLISPLTGTVHAVNCAVLDDPGLVLASPYDEGWLVEIAVAGDDAERDLLLDGDLARAWFIQAVAEHREKGLVAE